MHQPGEPRGAGQPLGAHLERHLSVLLPLQPPLWAAEIAGKSCATPGVCGGGSREAPPCPRCRALQQELTFTVCLQYRYRHVADFVEERRAVSVGRPLIAKLNLSPPDPGKLPASGGSGSPLSASPPSSWGNSPEENLSPEVPGSHGV